MALKIHPRICLNCSFSNVEKAKPSRVSIPCIQRIKSDGRIQSLRSFTNVPHIFPAFRTPFGCSSSNSRMSASFSYFGLIGECYSTYFGSVTRITPRVGTVNYVVHTQSRGSQRNYSFKTSKKHQKSVKSYAAHENEKCVQEVANSCSEGIVAGSEDAKLSSLNGRTVKDKGDSVLVRRMQTDMTKSKVKQQSRSKKKQSQPSSGGALTDVGDMLNSTGKRVEAKKTRNKKNKETELSVTDVSENSISKKVAVKSARKKKPNMKADSIPKSNEGLAVQTDGNASAGHTSPLIKATKSQGRKAWPQLYPPITKSVLVVESVTKAKVIQGYLGEMYKVLPSYGHVRDLAARSGSVQPDDDFSMVWEVLSPAWSHLKSIKVSLSGAENLILASDPDREGEAIAWHIVEMLQEQDALHEDVTVARVVFNEITESSIKSALQSPREIDADLVNAYLARRALDYLIGFNISPLLWRKLPGCQSAGRVQSAALALICDREKEIDEFKAQEYWTIDAQFQKEDSNSDYSVSLSSHLTHFDSKRLMQLSISSDAEAKDIEEKINISRFEVTGSKTSKIRRNPPTPYITSTLQQDAANKLNFSASYTMKVAQKLYEGVQLSDDKATGLITYMRTDGLQLSDEAAKGIQSFVGEKYGLNFATETPRKYFKKVKNSQEAHEAIRPTDIRRLPSMLVCVLDEDSLKLYTLIWSRTMACQMEPVVIEQIQCDIGNANNSIMFRSLCSRVAFLGFQAVYDDVETMNVKHNEDDEDNRSGVFEILSNLKCGEPLLLTKVEPEQHYTQPPSRYSEGSLVKKLEELGIGRPSTYATTIKVLKDRKYITTKGRTLYPEFRGRMVSAFLSCYFSEVTNYSFTADMETELDNVSAGTTEWKGLLNDYWMRFSKYCESAGGVHIHEVEKMLEKTFGDYLFTSLRDGNRTCPSCLEGTLIFKVSRFGAGYFLGCDQHPKCKYIAKTLYGENGDEEIDPEQRKNNIQEPKLLGVDPVTKEEVLLKAGPYGYYLQLGEGRKGYSPKRTSISRIKDVNSITLEHALVLLKYPVTLGNHPDDNQPVILKLATAGFSIQHRRTFAPVPKNMNPDGITLEKALELLKSKDVRRRGRPKRNVAVEEPVEAM